MLKKLPSGGRCYAPTCVTPGVTARSHSISTLGRGSSVLGPQSRVLSPGSFVNESKSFGAASQGPQVEIPGDKILDQLF